MKALVTSLNSIDRRALGLGLGAVFGFYALVLGYAWVAGEGVVERLEQTLAQQSVPLIVPAETQAAATKNPSPELQATSAQETSSKPLPLLIDGLYEKTTQGNLPMINPKTRATSFGAYRRPFDFPADAQPILAVVVTDFGLSKSASQTALDLLPPEVSYVIAADTRMGAEWAKILRQSGREFWLGVPMNLENGLGGDLGPSTIYGRASFLQNQKNLHRALSMASAYPGVTAFAPTVPGGDVDMTRKIMAEIYGRGLGYFEVNPKANTVYANIALAANAPYIKADMELIFGPGQNPFTELEDLLQKQGFAVAVLTNSPKNIERLAQWLLKVGRTSYTLAPVSAIYDVPLHGTQTQQTPTPQEALLNQEAGGLRNADLAEPSVP